MHRITPDGKADLESIWYYIASRSGSTEIADRLIDRIVDTLLLLASRPYIGRARDTDLRPGLRTFPVAEYVVVYRLELESVLVL